MAAPSECSTNWKEISQLVGTRSICIKWSMNPGDLPYFWSKKISSPMFSFYGSKYVLDLYYLKSNVVATKQYGKVAVFLAQLTPKRVESLCFEISVVGYEGVVRGQVEYTGENYTLSGKHAVEREMLLEKTSLDNNYLTTLTVNCKLIVEEKIAVDVVPEEMSFLSDNLSLSTRMNCLPRPINNNNWEVTTSVEEIRGSLKWTIKNWEDETLESPAFNCFSTSWALEYDPNVGFYLKALSLNREIEIKCKMSLKDENNLDHCVTETEVVFRDDNQRSDLCLDLEDIEDEIWDSLTGDALTVCCELIAEDQVIHGQLKAVDESTICKDDDGGNSIPPQAPLPSTKALGVLLNDFQALLKERKNCDVTLQVGDESIPAHKCILVARSPVFAAMFEHDTEESHSGIVAITDIPSSVIKDLLQYVYCGNVSDMSTEKALVLFAAADKYALLELKEACADILKKSISVDNISDIATLADAHNDGMIMDSVKRFARENPRFLSSEKWKCLVEQNSRLAYEITLTFALEAPTKS